MSNPSFCVMQATVWPSWCFDQKTQPVSGVWRPSTPCVRWSNPGFDQIYSALHLSSNPLPFASVFVSLVVIVCQSLLSSIPWLYITFKGTAVLKTLLLCTLPNLKWIHSFVGLIQNWACIQKNLSLVWFRFAPRLTSRTCASSMWGGRLRGRPETAVVQAGLWGITWLSSLMPPAASASPHTKYYSFLLIENELTNKWVYMNIICRVYF